MVYSIFPFLLSYSIYAEAFFRVALAIIVFILATRTYRASRDLKVSGVTNQKIPMIVTLLEALSAIFIFLGLYTQAAAGILAITTLVASSIRRKFSALAIESALFYLLIAFASISIVVVGAGFPALDLPI